MQAKGLTPTDVITAINAQNLTLPSGTAKIGDIQYKVKMNNSPSVLDSLNNIPIKVENGVVTVEIVELDTTLSDPRMEFMVEFQGERLGYRTEPNDDERRVPSAR